MIALVGGRSLLALLKAKMAKMSAVGRPTGRIWRIQGTPINTGPGGEVFVDVRAAESAHNGLNDATAAKRGHFGHFRFLPKSVGSTS